MKMIKESLSEFVSGSNPNRLNKLNELTMADISKFSFGEFPLGSEDKETTSSGWSSELARSETFRDVKRNFTNGPKTKRFTPRKIEKIYKEIIEQLDGEVMLSRPVKIGLFPFYTTDDNRFRRDSAIKKFAEAFISYVLSQPTFERSLSTLSVNVTDRVREVIERRTRNPLIDEIKTEIGDLDIEHISMDLKRADNEHIKRVCGLNDEDLVVRGRYGDYEPMVIKEGDILRRFYEDDDHAFNNAVREFYAEDLKTGNYRKDKNIYQEVSSASVRFIINNDRSFFITDAEELGLDFS